MPKKRRRAGANALWRGRRPGVSPVMLALIVAVGAIVAVGGMLLTQRAAREDAAAPSGLQISQIVADNASTLITETGYVPDLIEVRNAGGEPVQLKGYSLLLGIEVNKIFSFPQRTLAPGETALVYCEGLEAGADHGDWSAPFRLPASGGEELVLLSPQDAAADSVTLPELGTDEAYVRAADGAWERTTASSLRAQSAAAGVRVQSGAVEISEVATDNVTYFADENGEFHDYIELHNLTGAPVNLRGWFLSDASSNVRRWALPDVVLPAGGYLAVHCSGYDRRDDPAHLHTDFRLGAGESAFLSTPGGQVASIATPPLLLPSQAWSLADGAWTAELAPTPGDENSAAGAARVNAASFGTSPVRLNEIMSSTMEQEYDWLELYNPTAQEVDLSGWGLSDNPARPRKWRFPEGTRVAPGAYLGVYLSGKSESVIGQALHANFSLSGEGGYAVTLADPEGRVQDAIHLPRQFGDVSYGRAEGEDGFFYFLEDTPLAANAGAHYRSRAAVAECSEPGGLYQSGQILSVELTAPEGSRIYYTLNNTDPDESATLYSGPIQVSGTTVLRTRVYRDGCMPSLMDSRSFLYDVENPDGLYVVSLVTDPGNLSGGNGILSDANLMLDLEREAHVELFTAGGETAISQECGISLHGADSRKLPIKSFNVIARRAYGANRFNYPIFSKRDYVSYQSFLLRPSGEDQSMTFMRDVVLSSLMEDTTVMNQAYEPTIFYLNGEYYTFCYLRERINKYSICQYENWIGMENDIDLVRANDIVVTGSNETFEQLLSWAKSSDMTTDEAYAVLDEHIDIRSYIEYMAMQILSGNSDTLNVRRYRNAKLDGKWRWAIFDLDWAYFTDVDSIRRWLEPGGVGVGRYTDNSFFIACMKNPRFRDEFLTYSGEWLATALSTENVLAKFTAHHDRIQASLAKTIEKWDLREIGRGNGRLGRYCQERPTKIIGYYRNALKMSDADVEKYFGAAIQKIREYEEANSQNAG